MQTGFRAGLAALALVLAMSLPTSAVAQEERNVFDRVGSGAFDVVLLRPTGAVRLVLGSAFAGVATVFPLAFVYPVGLATGKMDQIYERSIFAYPLGFDEGRNAEIYDRAVVEPFDYTFRRKIGEF